MFNGYKSEMGIEVKLAKWTDLPDQPELFPEGKAKAIPQRKIWVERILEEQAELKAKGSSSNTHHRTWTAKSTTTSSIKETSISITVNGEEKQQDQPGEDPIHESSDDIGDGLKRKHEDEEDVEQSLLMKKIRDENMMNNLDKKLRLVSNFQELPRVGGYVDTLQPLPSSEGIELQT
mmetsp:Transcript_36090/g.44916  ORF Transcript_36090/g.44916 Transcript_36090/m.44916 type:complete len:177 (+) Transcript_36090:85-615(+)